MIRRRNEQNPNSQPQNINPTQLVESKLSGVKLWIITNSFWSSSKVYMREGETPFRCSSSARRRRRVLVSLKKNNNRAFLPFKGKPNRKVKFGTRSWNFKRGALAGTKPNRLTSNFNLDKRGSSLDFLSTYAAFGELINENSKFCLCLLWQDEEREIPGPNGTSCTYFY